MDKFAAECESKNHKSTFYDKFQSKSIRWLVYISLLFNIVILVIIISTSLFLTNKYNEILDRLPDTDQLLPEKRNPSKRSTTAPSVHDMLQRKLPGLEAIKLIGAQSLLQVNRSSAIGPWVYEGGRVDWALIGGDGKTVNILATGLYFVYAQLYYFTKEPFNSYEIIRWKKDNNSVLEGISKRELLTACANQAAISTGRQSDADISCYTGVITTLHPGDVLSIYQTEQRRVLIFSPGFSHWGIIRMQTN